MTQIGWPDYVFDKTYTLPSLASVERYIRLHGHLPGIAPATAIVESRRLDLGANEAALMRKIEELTLYVLEQDKKAKDQQQEIERLKVENQQVLDLQREIDQLKEMMKELKSKTN